jgi:dipeptidyl aminopeptidase/acylaminoacyl peptidase
MLPETWGRIVHLFVSAAVTALAVATAAHAAPPPASAFGRIPAVVDAEISPDGHRVAVLGGEDTQRVLSIATIDKPTLPVLQLGDVEITEIDWVGDAFVIAKAAYWEKADARRTYRIERHIGITPEAKAVSRFLGSGSASAVLVEQPLVGVTASPPRAIVLAMADAAGVSATIDSHIRQKRGDAAISVWSVDPANGRSQLIQRGDVDAATWAVDLAGQPRVRIDIDALSNRYAVYGRLKGQDRWTRLHGDAQGGVVGDYRGYSEPDEAIYLMTERGLVQKRIADGAVATLAEQAPSLQLVRDSHRNTAIGVASGLERPTYRWLDPDVGAAHGTLARAFRAQDVQLQSWSQDRTRFVARASAPAAPPVWYLYDKARKEISPLGEEYPELKGVALGTTRYFTYKARDGLEIPAYVTLPPGAAAGARRPLIVLPHGGPRARDTYRFDYLAQFLATRGYVVLQPQFRGSAGLGAELEKAGQGEWAGKMQTDLLDGVAALATAGDIDPARVCVVGASYGGYAALAGAAFHPDAYRCAVSVAGISDIGQMLLEETRIYGQDSLAMEALRAELAATSRAKLDEASPRLRAAAIKAPILLIHGDKDTIVRVEQSQRMAEALAKAGKPHELVVVADESHYFTRGTNRTRMLEKIEAFLATNLPTAN